MTFPARIRRAWRALLGWTRRVRDDWRVFWRTPEPNLVDAGAGGEILVAKIRLALVALIFYIPLRGLWPWPPDKEVMVGFVTAGTGLLLAGFIYLYSRRNLYRPWVGFATSAMDVTLVSLALAAFLALDRPHTAVNSKVVYEIYLIAIAATALRFDPRVSVVTGALAFGQYAVIALYAGTHWNLNDPRYAPFTYGMFDWGTQTSRLILIAIAAAASTAIVSRSRRLQWLSARDRLTGLLNRGILDDLLIDEASRALRYGRSLSVLMIDIDHFKLLNDAHGHPAGDDALRLVASVIRQAVRQREAVARYGGDEFVVLLPETQVETAVERAEAIRQAVAAALLALHGVPGTVAVTVSVGVAALPNDGTDGHEVLGQADARLLDAKQAGRNRVLGPPPVLAAGA